MNIYINIIFKYAYPYCTRSTNILLNEEKQLIINDEFNLIKTKIEEYELINSLNLKLNIYQLPKILYDLFNIYIYIYNLIKSIIFY